MGTHMLLRWRVGVAQPCCLEELSESRGLVWERSSPQGFLYGASPPVQIIDAPPSATLPAISATTYVYRWPDARSGSAVELKD